MGDPFEDRLHETVAEIDYRGWQFRLDKDAIGLWFLQVVFVAGHSQTGAVIHCHGRKWRISMHMTRSEIVQTALKAVLMAEEHEAREHFLWRDRAIFAPHLDVEALWNLTGDPQAQEHR